MPAPSTRRISEDARRPSPNASTCSIRIRPGRRSMPRTPEGQAPAMLRMVRLALLALFIVLPATPSLAQAPGYVRLKLVKAGLMLGTGGGSGVLTYRGRDYPFRV